MMQNASASLPIQRKRRLSVSQENRSSSGLSFLSMNCQSAGGAASSQCANRECAASDQASDKAFSQRKAAGVLLHDTVQEAVKPALTFLCRSTLRIR